MRIGEMVKVEINSNNISNNTLAKLTRDEIAVLGLQNIGVGLYRGDLKTRYNGMSRKSEDGVTFWFESEKRRIEFTEIVSTEDGVRYWAQRTWNKEFEGYETWPCGEGIYGCNFFRPMK